MLKLLQINTVINTGSTGRIAEAIGQLAIKNGWDSYIAYGRYEGFSQSKTIKIGSDFDIKLHGLQTRFFDRHGLGSFRATLNLIEQIKIIKPDIIHLHNLHGYYINIKLLFKYLEEINLPIVWTFHDCWPITGHCTYFDYINCQKWKLLCYDCPQKNKYPSSFFIDRSEKNYLFKKKLFNSLKNLTIVPVSQWLGNILSQSFLSSLPLHVIHNGIDLNVFKPISNKEIREKYKLENKFIILGVASIWSPRKGLSDFIELSKMIDKNCIIILIGLSKKQIRNLPSNIIVISHTENTQELAEFYSIADIYINPTWEDNFPTTNLEALACGTPIITYKTGGSIESVSTDTGYIVEKGNLFAVIDKINIIKSKGKASYSEACKDRAEKLYNKKERFEEYIQLYNRLLQTKK